MEKKILGWGLTKKILKKRTFYYVYKFYTQTAVYDMYVKVIRDMCTDVICKCSFLERIMDG